MFTLGSFSQPKKSNIRKVTYSQFSGQLHLIFIFSLLHSISLQSLFRNQALWKICKQLKQSKQSHIHHI